jgi:hypothetical protein
MYKSGTLAGSEYDGGQPCHLKFAYLATVANRSRQTSAHNQQTVYPGALGARDVG